MAMRGSWFQVGLGGWLLLVSGCASSPSGAGSPATHPPSPPPPFVEFDALEALADLPRDVLKVTATWLEVQERAPPQQVEVFPGRIGAVVQRLLASDFRVLTHPFGLTHLDTPVSFAISDAREDLALTVVVGDGTSSVEITRSAFTGPDLPPETQQTRAELDLLATRQAVLVLPGAPTDGQTQVLLISLE